MAEIKKDWHIKDADYLYKYFESGSVGLSEVQVLNNRDNFGPNVLEVRKKVTFFDIFLTQFKSVFIYVLAIAALIVFLLGEYLDGFLVLGIILLNAFIGTIQEGKARDTLEELQKSVRGSATVLRNNVTTLISDEDVVAGDILILKDGDVVTADARLIETNYLKINQSSLTGESESIIKNIEILSDENMQISDQNNMVFKGTHVISGYGRAIVVATGKETTIGNIAEVLDDLRSEMPLEKNIENLSKIIMFLIIFISIALFIVGSFYGMEFSSLFLVIVAVAISAIPESLPVVVTLVLAAGVFRMSKKNVLVKRLQAVESLGQAKILALDKTGTITLNQMEVSKIFLDDNIYNVTGNGYEPVGDIMFNDSRVVAMTMPSMSIFGQITAFCSNAGIAFNQDKKEWERTFGDPTEAALRVFAEKIGLVKEDLESQYARIFEIPFDFHRKYHAVINKIDNKDLMFVSGSPEVLLNWSHKIYKDGKEINLTEEDKDKIYSIIKQFSSEGFRVIAGAVHLSPDKNFEKINPNELEKLTFVGLFAIKDAIRPQVYEAIDHVSKAGMRAIMITGDHKETAQAIGKDIGLYKEGDRILSGEEIDAMSDDELKNSVGDVSIFARVSPHHKLRIIQAFKNRKEVIAMTGDGINDALSLTAADLGVSMGKEGTSVAREAADIILLDDNFDNISYAVLEGRNIYMTIKKTVLYLLSTNIGEVMVISIAIFAGLPLPLLATQIIWLNMVTDTFLVASLALEPHDKTLTSRSFIISSKWIVDWQMALRIILIGGVMTAGTLWLFLEFLPQGMTKAWAISLSALTVFQWYNIFNIRSDQKSVFSFSLWSNKYLFVSLVLVVLLHFFALYTPFMQKALSITGLSVSEWVTVLTVCLSVIAVEEIRKLITRKFTTKY